MQNKVKNSETPYFSTSPVQDQFGQLIVAFGVTKREKLAMDIFKEMIRGYTFEKAFLKKEMLINQCYELADIFLNFEDIGQKETSSLIF
jgi:hypothetical protein